MKKKITISVAAIALATILIAPKTITKGNASNDPIDHVTPPTITLATDKEMNIKDDSDKKDKNEPKQNNKETSKENINQNKEQNQENKAKPEEKQTPKTSASKSSTPPVQVEQTKTEKPAAKAPVKETPTYDPNTITYNNFSHPIVVGGQDRVNQKKREWVNFNYFHSKNCPQYKLVDEDRSIWLAAESVGWGKDVWNLDSFIFTDINGKSKKYVFLGTTETIYYYSNYLPDNLWYIMLGYGGDTIVLQTCNPDSNNRGIAKGYIFVPEDKVPASGEITVTIPDEYIEQPAEMVEYIVTEYVTEYVDENSNTETKEYVEYTTEYEDANVPYIENDDGSITYIIEEYTIEE